GCQAASKTIRIAIVSHYGSNDSRRRRNSATLIGHRRNPLAAVTIILPKLPQICYTSKWYGSKLRPGAGRPLGFLFVPDSERATVAKMDLANGARGGCGHAAPSWLHGGVQGRRRQRAVEGAVLWTAPVAGGYGAAWAVDEGCCRIA